MIATILGSHSEIILHPKETFAFVRKEPQAISELLSYRYPPEKSWLLEKTPKHLYYVDEIKDLFGDAKVILTVRNPLNLAASYLIRFQDWNLVKKRVNKDFKHLLKFRGYGKVVRLEDLTSNPETVVTEVCQSIGIVFEPGMLRFHEKAPNWFNVREPRRMTGTQENFRIRRQWQINQPIFPSEDVYQESLTKLQIREMLEDLRDIPQEFGYDLTGLV